MAIMQGGLTMARNKSFSEAIDDFEFAPREERRISEQRQEENKPTVKKTKSPEKKEVNKKTLTNTTNEIKQVKKENKTFLLETAFDEESDLTERRSVALSKRQLFILDSIDYHMRSSSKRKGRNSIIRQAMSLYIKEICKDPEIKRRIEEDVKNSGL